MFYLLLLMLLLMLKANSRAVSDAGKNSVPKKTLLVSRGLPKILSSDEEKVD